MDKQWVDVCPCSHLVSMQVSAAASRLGQGRSGQSVAVTGFPSTLLQVSGSRELLLALGYSVRYVLVTEDELLVAPEHQMLPMLTRAEACLQSLLGM